MNINVRTLTEKARKFIEIEEEEALVGTIKFRRPKLDREAEKGARFVRVPNFGIPGLCPERPVSADGRVAFHFKHTFVVKKASYGRKDKDRSKSTALVVSGDSDGFSTDAADHERYISRDGNAKAIPAAEYDHYIEIGSIHVGAGVVISNISSELDRRVDFWNAVTRRERNPSPDRVTLHPDRLSGEQWARVIEAYDGPPAIMSNLVRMKLRRDEAEAFGLPNHSKAIGFEMEFREFTVLRKLLKRMGAWDRDRPAATIKRGRGGRVQRRMVAEFPLGLNDAARLRIARLFADYLAGKGMMHTAVIHPPDAHNDKRNFHMHVAAYDRPCEYLEEHQCWDFDYAVPVDGQHNRFKFPKRKNKVGSLTRPGPDGDYREHGAAVLTELRKTFAELCNDELRNLKINRLFDHRSYVAMGIKQQPGKHLGTKAASLEAVGVPTSGGIDNAEKSWQGAFDRVVDAHRMRQELRTDCCANASEVLSRCMQVGVISPVASELRHLSIEFDKQLGEIGDQERDVALYLLTLQMAYSKPDSVSEVCQRLIEAIENGSATATDRKWEDEIRDRLKEAEDYADRIYRAIHLDVEQVTALGERVQGQAVAIAATMAKMSESIDQLDALLAEYSPLLAAPSQEAVAGPAEASVTTSVPIRPRQSRELEAYFAAPLDYEDAWNSVFFRVQVEELEIKAPKPGKEDYHVPGISKEDLDRLLNPVFVKRSQARLRAMYEIQELNRHRAELPREAAEAAGPLVDSDPSEPRWAVEPLDQTNGVDVKNDGRTDRASTQPPVWPDVDYGELLERTKKEDDKKRDEAAEDWFAEFTKHYQGKTWPITFEGDTIVVDVTKLRKELQPIAEAFPIRVAEQVQPKVAELREVMRNQLLGASRPLVHFQGNTPVYDPKDFLAPLRPNLGWLLERDPVVRGYASQAITMFAGRAANQTAQMRNSTNAETAQMATQRSQATTARAQSSGLRASAPVGGYSLEEQAFVQNMNKGRDLA